MAACWPSNESGSAMMLDLTQCAFMTGAVARLTLACIFALSAIEAMRAIDIHAAITERYELLPNQLVAPAARVLPALNLVAAVMLLPPVTAFLGAALGLVLMLLFTAAVSINLWRGRDYIDCGCGGAAGQRLSIALVIRNLILVGLLLLSLTTPAHGPLDMGVITGVLGGAASLVAFYFAGNQLLTNRQMLKTLAPVH